MQCHQCGGAIVPHPQWAPGVCSRCGAAAAAQPHSPAAAVQPPAPNKSGKLRGLLIALAILLFIGGGYAFAFLGGGFFEALGAVSLNGFAEDPSQLRERLVNELGGDRELVELVVRTGGGSVDVRSERDPDRIERYSFNLRGLNAPDRLDTSKNLNVCTLDIDEIDFSVAPEIIDHARREASGELRHIMLTNTFCHENGFLWHVHYAGGYLAYDLEGQPTSHPSPL